MYIGMYLSKHHGKILKPKRPKFGMCSLRIQESIIKLWGHGNRYGFGIATHPQELFCPEKVDQKLIKQKVGIWSTSPWESILTTYGCSLAIATLTGSCFGY